MSHSVTFRVYYEDTDAGGVVYYANYLKFAERARTELLRSCDLHQTELAEKEGILFVVRHIEANFKKPARLDDLITIETAIAETNGASLTMHQSIKREAELLVTLKVTVVCIDSTFKPTRMPGWLRGRITDGTTLP